MAIEYCQNKCPDKSTARYAMLGFESDIENLRGKYLVIERHILQIQDMLLQYLKFNLQIFPLQMFYITFKI